jgi:exopolysaccharide biosynthesis polyprenyl glycosylphosphotransferase
MGELTTNRLLPIEPEDGPSQYARMIFGVSVIPLSLVARRSAAASGASPGTTLGNAAAISSANGSRATAARKSTRLQQLLPHSSGNRFRLFQLMAADLIVLGIVCGATLILFPAGGLPWAYVPVFAVLVTLFGLSEGIYQNDWDSRPAASIPALARSTGFAIGLVYIAARAEMRPAAAIIVLAGSVAGLALGRSLRQIAGKQRRETEALNTLIVGAGPVAHSIARALRSDPLHRAVVCGFVDDEQPLSPTVLGRIADLDWLARAEFIDEVIVVLPGQPAQAREVAEIAFRNHLDIRAVPDWPSGAWPDAGVDHIGDVPVVTLHREPLPGLALFLKHWLDITGAAVTLALVSPLMAVVALLVRLDSPGPAVYAAERTGAKGRRFRCFKFRSMVTNAAHLKDELRARNQREGPIFKIDDDPRITRVGRIIRRYSLDELPQLWNVLRGEMSLVGPRPHPVDEVNHYELQHYRRLDVKPGITGLWQITARDCPSFELAMHLDLTYIENWSLLLDLRILARTVHVLFAPEGA